MQDLLAELAKKSGSQRKPRTSSDQHTALDRCYGQIGISAVAAAARYQSGAENHAKNPGHAPAETKRAPRSTAFR
jgi:hypothetical protein